MALWHSARSEDADVSDNLLGQVPVLRRRPSPDIGRTEEIRDNDPSFLDGLLRSHRFNRHKNIDTALDPAQPALITPTCQRFGCFFTAGSQNPCYACDRQNVPILT